MWLQWAALDIFSRGIFMVYLKLVDCKFAITKTRTISVTIFYFPLFGSVFSSLWRPLIYVCVIYVWNRHDVKNSNM